MRVTTGTQVGGCDGTPPGVSEPPTEQVRRKGQVKAWAYGDESQALAHLPALSPLLTSSVPFIVPPAPTM